MYIPSTTIAGGQHLSNTCITSESGCRMSLHTYTRCRPIHPIPVQCWASVAAHRWFNAAGLGGGPRVVVSTAAFHARVWGSVPGFGGLKETKNVSSPSTCESQYCGEPQ